MTGEEQNRIKIFIDQGHNPRNPNAGAEGNGLREQDLTYEIGRRLAQLLNEDARFAAKLSRNSPEEVLGTSNATSLAARTNAANEWGADWFISIHLNAAEQPAANGSEAFVYATGGVAEEFAASVLTGLTDATGFRNLGVFARPGLYVLRRTAMPATLVEVGFLTNPAEAIFMRDNTALIAKGMYNGIVAFFAGS